MPDYDYLGEFPSGFLVLHGEDGQQNLHAQECFQILLFQRGSRYEIEGKTYFPEPGDLLLISDCEIRQPEQTAASGYSAYVDASFFDSAVQFTPGGEDLSRCFAVLAQNRAHLLRLPQEEQAHVLRIFESLSEVGREETFGGDTLRQCYMVELLVRLNRASMEETAVLEKAEYNRKIEQVVTFLNQNLRENLTLDLLSLRFSISKYHLTREFKRCLGLSLHQYLMKKRLLAARSGLRRGEAIGEVFSESGFGDYSHFSRAFRDAFGASPREYRKRSLENRLFEPGEE